MCTGGADVADARAVAAAMIAAAGEGATGRRDNLTGTWHPLRENLDTIAAESGVRAPRVLPDPVTDVVAAAGGALAAVTNRDPGIGRRAVPTFRDGTRTSSQRAAQELGFAPRPFAETARDMMAWFRAQGMLSAR